MLWRGPGGKLFPYYIRRGSGDEEDFIDFAPDGSPSRIDAGGQHRLVLFCEEWLTGAS